MSLDTHYTSSPVVGIRIPRTGDLPEGFQRGAHVSRNGNDHYYVIRDTDGASIVCPASPCDDEILPPKSLSAALSAACDQAKTKGQQ